MKKLFVPFVITALLIITSCGKDNDAPNRFTYKDIAYRIDSVALLQIVSNHGTASEKDIFQFIFFNFNEGDTTMLYMALYDENSMILGGDYPSLLINTTETRRLLPWALICTSAITFQDDTWQYTGEGGSIDVRNNSGTYTIKFNKISMGIYQDMFDSNDDDDVEYTEVGTINGSYKGVIDKTIYNLSKEEETNNPVFK